MRYVALLLAAVALVLPACQSVPPIQPKAKLMVETPADMQHVNYKLEVLLN